VTYKKILTGEKTVETRWYKTKYRPYDQVKVGEVVYFKDSGCPITVKAAITKVEQFDNLTSEKTQEILNKYGHADLWTTEIKQDILDYVTNKNYCIIVHLWNPESVKQFDIDKTGFGAMASWICIDDIEKIKRK
jgi:ASC-1-like (ASCH) protein